MSDSIISEIRTIEYSDGAIQRVQVVKFGDFAKLDFFTPDKSLEAFENLCRLYQDFIIKKYRKLLGYVVLFRLSDSKLPEEMVADGIKDSMSNVSQVFRKHIHCKKGKLVFDNDIVKNYFEKLQNENNLFIVKGDRNHVSFLPYGDNSGFMTRSETDAKLKVNSSFFVFDVLDIGSIYDKIGIPVSFMCKGGRILNPPQYDREAFLIIKDGTTQVRKLSLTETEVIIDSVKYRHGENAVFYEKSKSRKTPKGGCDIVVVANRVVGVNKGGKSQIPSGGFVIKTDKTDIVVVDLNVSYSGFEDIAFGIQAGNSAVINGKKTEKFTSPFYNIRQFWKSPFPPSMYPLNYEKDRAPRIVIGADENGKGMLLWFEGAGKFGYEKGKESCGASLSECREIAKSVGMINGVHLDGGGSAQILIDNERWLKVSDRNPDNFSQKERAIPVGLIIR